MALCNDVCLYANRWLGTPYHHQARVRGVGVDCAMLLCEVFEAAGMIPFIDPRPYPPDWHLHRSEEKYLGWIEQYADELKADETPQPGDVVLYKFGRTVSHAGIVIDWPMIIHAYRGQGCVMSEGDRGELGGRIAGFWRVRSSQKHSPQRTRSTQRKVKNEQGEKPS